MGSHPGPATDCPQPCDGAAHEPGYRPAPAAATASADSHTTAQGLSILAPTLQVGRPELQALGVAHPAHPLETGTFTLHGSGREPRAGPKAEVAQLGTH